MMTKRFALWAALLLVSTSLTAKAGGNLWYFVVDRSGSIGQRKLEAPIRDAIFKTVNSRNENDEIRIVFFSDRAGDKEAWPSMTLNAKTSFQKHFERRFKARGKTRLYDTVAEVIEEVNRDEGKYQIVNVLILSDGEDSLQGVHRDWSTVDKMAGQLKADKERSLLLWYTLGFQPKTRPKNIEVSVVTNPAEVKTFEPPPKAAFDAVPEKVKVGEEVLFDLKEAAGGIVDSCRWSFGDGKTMDLAGKDFDAKHKYVKVGAFDVTLTVKGPGGEDSLSVSQAVHVMEIIPLAADFHWLPEKPRAGEQVVFVNRSTGGPTKYEWTIGGSTSKDVAPSHSFRKAGSFNVALKALRENEATDCVKTLTVRPPIPNPDFKCDPSDVLVLGSGKISLVGEADEPGTKHTWMFANGEKQRGRVLQVEPTTTGMYEIWHQVESAGGIASKSQRIYIRKPDQPDPSFTINKTYVEIGSPDSFFVCVAKENRAGHTHKWNVIGSEDQGTGPKFKWVPGKPGKDYKIQHEVTGPGGTALSEQGVVANKAEGIVVKFKVNPKKGKAPLRVAFVDKSEGKIVAYAWDFGDGTTANVKNPEHDYEKAGRYMVVLKATNPEGRVFKSTEKCSISVTPPPPPWLWPVIGLAAATILALVLYLVLRPPALNGTVRWEKQDGSGKGEFDLHGRGKCRLEREVNESKPDDMDEWKPDEAAAIVRRRNKAYYLFCGGIEDRLLHLPKDRFEHAGMAFSYENEFDEPVDPDRLEEDFDEEDE